jgi:Pentapeptide repeats (8 copies)
MDANLTGANLRSARLAGANLTGAAWPHGLTVPEGWQRNPDSGRLARAGH